MKVTFERVNLSDEYIDVDMYLNDGTRDWVCRATMDREMGLPCMAANPQCALPEDGFDDPEDGIPDEVMDTFERAFPEALRFMSVWVRESKIAALMKGV